MNARAALLAVVSKWFFCKRRVFLRVSVDLGVSVVKSCEGHSPQSHRNPQRHRETLDAELRSNNADDFVQRRLNVNAQSAVGFFQRLKLTLQ